MQTLAEILDIALYFQQENAACKRREGHVTDWMLVAMVLDRFLLIVFLLLNIFVSCGILLNHPAGMDPETLVNQIDEDREHLSTYIE